GADSLRIAYHKQFSLHRATSAAPPSRHETIRNSVTTLPIPSYCGVLLSPGPAPPPSEPSLPPSSLSDPSEPSLMLSASETSDPSPHASPKVKPATSLPSSHSSERSSLLKSSYESAIHCFVFIKSLMAWGFVRARIQGRSPQAGQMFAIRQRASWGSKPASTNAAVASAQSAPAASRLSASRLTLCLSIENPISTQSLRAPRTKAASYASRRNVSDLSSKRSSTSLFARPASVSAILRRDGSPTEVRIALQVHRKGARSFNGSLSAISQSSSGASPSRRKTSSAGAGASGAAVVVVS
ncbi:hypothetical protein DFJ74DRAFT_741718, partial [Hyaloraphidium curvatum]